MTNYFSKLRGARTSYVSDDDGMLVESRDIICHFGEDPSLCIDAFWDEHRGEGPFLVIPQFAYGNAPRAGLCSQRSLTEAWDGFTEKRVGRKSTALMQCSWRAS